MIVEPASPRDQAANALLRASHALMQSLFPPESNHFLSIDALCGPDVRFYLGRVDGNALGCGALAIRNGYGEVKSMFVAPAARGIGLGSAILARLEADARADGLPLLRLETGDLLHAAHRLYARHGFTDCGPFGDYPDHKSSVFMEKAL